MLITQTTLVKSICIAAPLILIYNFLSLTNPLTQLNPAQATQQANTTLYTKAPAVFHQLFTSPEPGRKDFNEWNDRTLRDLHACIALNTCGPNQKKVALLADGQIRDAVVGGWRGGEGVWGLSIYKNLRDLGYTTLFSTRFSETLAQYRMFPDLVKVVIRGEMGECHHDPNCVKSPTNPSGIPAWKLFEWSYWSDERENDENVPMKGKWIVSAVPDLRFPVSEYERSPIQYLGYSTEDICTQIPLIPLAHRPRRVWLLMKQLIYVYVSSFSWNRTYFPSTSQLLNVTFTGGWEIDRDYLGWGKDIHEDMVDIEDREKGVVNVGMKEPQEFYEEIRRSRLMVGVGNPHWSPSPVDALCLGVPFLNPISNWDENDPWNKSKWDTQHPTLVEYDRPFVYHVHAKNFTGFVEAIESAINTPIPRLIPEHMTEKAVQERLTKLMETDWRERAEEVLRVNLRRVESGEKAYIFEL